MIAAQYSITSLSDANIIMQEDQLSSSRGDVTADEGFVDASLETSDGSRDANMESDVFRRGRWRRPLSEFLDLHQVLFSTEGIISTRLWIYVSSEEVDIYHVVDRPSLVMGLSLLGSQEDKWWIVTVYRPLPALNPASLSIRSVLRLDVSLGTRHYILDTSTLGGDKLIAVIILRIMDPSEFSTLVTPSGVNTNIYPSMDTRPIGVIVCLRQHDLSALLMTLFWKLDIQFLGTSSIKRQHIDVVIFGEHRHIADHLLDGTHDFLVVNRGVMFFSCEGLILTHYLLRLWGVMVIFSVDFIWLHDLSQWTQHVRYYNQLVTKIHVAWGDVLQSTYALLGRTETLLTSTTSIDVFQDESSGVIITHKYQKIDRCMIFAHSCHNSDHTSNKILFITIAWSVLELLVRYDPSHIQGYAFVRGMISYVSTALELLRYHKMMIGEYCPVKMRYFINLEFLLSCEMNGEQIPSIEYLSVMIRRYHYPAKMRDFIISELIWYYESNGIQFYKTKNGEQVLLYKLMDIQEDSAVGSQVVVCSPAAKIEFYHHRAQLVDAECNALVLKSLQDFAAQFYSHDSRDLADRIYIVVACRLHRFSFAEITRGHRQYHVLLRNVIINNVFLDRHHSVMVTAEEYGETSSSTRLHHIIRPSEDTSFCKSYNMLALLGTAVRENIIRSQISDGNSAIFSAQFGYGNILMVEYGAILVSIDSDSRHMMIARFASRIVDRKRNIYVIRNQVNSVLHPDLVSYERHRLGLNHGERSKRAAIQELMDASRTNYHEIIVGSRIITRCNRLYGGFFVDIFVCGFRFFVRSPERGFSSSVRIFDVYDQLHYQVADDRIYLEVQVKNGNRPFSQVTNGNRPFVNNHNALSSTFSMADLHLPSPKEEELLIQYPTPTGQIKDYQDHTPTGQINDYQELLEIPTIMETTSHNNKFTAQMFFEISDYLLKWEVWNTIYVWLGSVNLCKKADERNRNRTSMSSMVHYLWILKILISRLMGIVPFIYRTLNVESSAIVGSAELIFPPYLYTRY